MAEFFPIFRRVNGGTVLVIGDNRAAYDKLEKLSAYPFNIIHQKEKIDDLQAFLTDTCADIVILADKNKCDAKKLFEYCISRRIELNTVDDMKNSTFIFPSLITGDLFSVAITTDGKCPSAAAKMRRIIEKTLPDETDDIIKQLSTLRGKLDSADKKQLMKKMCDTAFEKGKPLADDEMTDFLWQK